MGRNRHLTPPSVPSPILRAPKGRVIRAESWEAPRGFNAPGSDHLPRTTQHTYRSVGNHRVCESHQVHHQPDLLRSPLAPPVGGGGGGVTDVPRVACSRHCDQGMKSYVSLPSACRHSAESRWLVQVAHCAIERGANGVIGEAARPRSVDWSARWIERAENRRACVARMVAGGVPRSVAADLIRRADERVIGPAAPGVDPEATIQARAVRRSALEAARAALAVADAAFETRVGARIERVSAGAQGIVDRSPVEPRPSPGVRIVYPAAFVGPVRCY